MTRKQLERYVQGMLRTARGDAVAAIATARERRSSDKKGRRFWDQVIDYLSAHAHVAERSARRRAPQQRECAWCKRVMRKGTLPATHGICSSCNRKYFGDTTRSNPSPGAAPRQMVVKTFRSARGHLVSGDVDAVSYVNIGSRSLQPYRHIFRGTDTELWALADGSLLIRNPSSRLWEDFTVEDSE